MMTFLAILFLALASDVAAKAEDLTSTVPLFRWKLELAQENQPYVHLTPEAAILYFKGMELKRLPVENLEALHRHPLRLSRVLLQTPVPRRPVSIVDEKNLEPLEDLSAGLVVEDMPATFSVHLENGTLLFVGTEQSQFVTFQSLKRIKHSEGPSHALFILMSPEASRQLYWHLQQSMGIIY